MRFSFTERISPLGHLSFCNLMAGEEEDANQRKIIIIIIYNKIKDIQIQSAFCLKIQNYMRKHWNKIHWWEHIYIFFLKKPKCSITHTQSCSLSTHRSTSTHLVTTAWAANRDDCCEEAGSLFESSSWEEEVWELRINREKIFTLQVLRADLYSLLSSFSLCLQTAVRNTPVRNLLWLFCRFICSSTAPSSAACLAAAEGSCFLCSISHLHPIWERCSQSLSGNLWLQVDVYMQLCEYGCVQCNVFVCLCEGVNLTRCLQLCCSVLDSIGGAESYRVSVSCVGSPANVHGLDNVPAPQSQKNLEQNI